MLNQKRPAGKSTAPQFVWNVLASGDDGPGPRSRHGFAYDPVSRSTMLFGGIVWDAENYLPADTWEFDGDSWEKIRLRVAPPGRHRGAMIYDAVRQQMVLFGGQGSSQQFFSDTWLYADHQWQKWPTGWWTRTPPARCGHVMVFDESLGETVLFGGVGRLRFTLGDTWLFNGDRWRRVRGPGPNPRRYASMAYDPDLKGCVLHGGSNDELGKECYGDAWLFRDGEWTALDSSFTTTQRDDHGFAYHRGADSLVMLNGCHGPSEVLTRGPRGWQRSMVKRFHPPHQCSPLVWNEALGGLLLHGGEVRHGGPQYDATWLLKRIGG